MGALIDTGILYAPNIIDAYTRSDGAGGLDVFWNVSTWNPYLVALLRTTVRPGAAAQPAALRIDDLPPGAYTICAVPIPADPGNPTEMERAREHEGALPAACVARVLDTAAQVVVSVPAAWSRAKR